MAEVTIGFNISEAKSLQAKIEEQFEAVKSTIQGKWTDVQTTLHTEWIGEDEEDFEKKFVARVNELYGQSKSLADGAVSMIKAISDSWKKFQESNVLTASEGNTTVTASDNSTTADVSNDESSGTKYESINVIDAQSENLDESTNRGLASAGSGGKIMDSVSKYVENIKSEIEGLFDSCTAGKAFFGEEQVSAVETFIKKVATAIGEVTTAVKDLHDALEKAAGENYTSAQTSFTSSITEETTNVDTSLNNVSNRWSGGDSK